MPFSVKNYINKMKGIATISYIFVGLLSTLERTLALRVRRQEPIKPENCTYYPQDSQFPCKQYIIGENCATDWLHERFPEVYKSSCGKQAYWAGSIKDLDANQELIKWRPPTDGSIACLRGFYIEFSVKSYGYTACVLIDLSSLTKDNLGELMNVTFTLNTTYAAGDYSVTTLPPPPPKHTQEAGEVSTIVRDYHPKFVKQTIVYHGQVNATCINITVVMEPAPEGVNHLYMMVSDASWQVMMTLSQELPFPEDFYIIDGFMKGNFSLKFSLIDENSGDLRKCVCYRGTADNRFCRPCTSISTLIHVRDVESTSGLAEAEGGASASVIAGAVTGSFLVLVVILATACFLLRCHVIPRDMVNRFLRRKKSAPVDVFPKLRTFFVYASDNPAHAKVVESFIKLMESYRGLEVINSDNTASPVASNDSLSSGGFRYGILLEQADIVIVVRSAWANALIEDMEMKTIYASGGPSHDDCSFISCMHQIKQNDIYASKLVNIRFEYSPESTTLAETSNGPVYSIPCDLQSFISHLYSNIEASAPAFTQSFGQEKDRLVQAIKSCYAYQRKDRNWLAKKMFLLKAYLSSDDSGISVQPQRRKLSVRSKSVDTVSSRRALSHSSQSYGRPCCYNQSRRLRTLSCDLSFCPPESDREDQSIRYSLLENKFIAINEKYEYILNYKLNSEDDCFTIDGKSV